MGVSSCGQSCRSADFDGVCPYSIGQVFLNDFLIVEKNLTAAEAAIVIPIQVSV